MPADDFVAAEEGGRLSEQAAAALARSDGVDWYEEFGTALADKGETTREIAAFAVGLILIVFSFPRRQPASR